MGLMVKKTGVGIGFFFEKAEHITLVDNSVTVDVTDEAGRELMGKLAAHYHPDFKAAHVINMAASLRTLTKLVDGEMHSIGHHLDEHLQDCMACHALEEADAASVLQDYDNAWKVDV